jgi:F-type H+-transporting ATPase subunit a
MPIANVLWKLFDMAIGGLQAFIFALLTVLYFAMAGAGHDEHEDEAAHEPAEKNAPAQPELAA